MTVSALPAAILAEASLVGYWPMDDVAVGTARDRGSHTLTGSYNANCLLSCLGIDGQPGGSVKFGEPKNLSQAMSIPWNTLFFQTSGSMEFCIRFNRFDFLGTGSQLFTAFGSAGPQVHYTSVGGNPGFDIKKQSSSVIASAASTPITDTYKWHHVIITWTTADGHVFIDGTDVSTPGVAQTMVTGTNGPMVWGDSFLQAAMAHCAYYSSSLSSAQVTTHYTAFQTDNATWPTSKSIAFGVHVGLQNVSGESVRQAQCTNLRQAHATVGRSEIDWSTTQTTSGGAYDWSIPDTIVADMVAAGITTGVFTVNGSPTWANGGAATTFVPGVSTVDAAFTTWIGKYQTFATDLINRYKKGGPGNPLGLDIYWEVWNEPNAVSFWTSGNSPQTSGAMYATLYKALYTTMKTADPTAKIVFGVLGGLWFNAPVNSTIGLQFVKDAIAVGGLTIDYASYHPYPSTTSGPDATPNTSNLFSDVLAYRDTLCSKGFSTAKILITEFGWDSTAVGTTNQAAYLQTALTRIRDQWSSFIPIALVYRDWDWNGTFGMFTTMPALPGLPTPKGSAQNFYTVAAPYAREERVGRVLI